MANKWHVHCPGVMPLGNVIAGYLQKKEKRKENTLSTKKKARFKKNDKGHEKKKENVTLKPDSNKIQE